jgi:diamine N-acetyltransferase
VRILVPQLRSAEPDDAATIAALSIQVFLDTYATEGIRPDLAREAFVEYSAEAFASRLQEPTRRFVLVEHATGLIGFAEIQMSPRSAPAGAAVGAELVRLYVQPQVQGRGIGRRLLQEAERATVAAALGSLWITAWEGNHRARGFYVAHGFQDVGATTYAFQGNSYGNRVFVKTFTSGASAA